MNIAAGNAAASVVSWQADGEDLCQTVQIHGANIDGHPDVATVDTGTIEGLSAVAYHAYNHAVFPDGLTQLFTVADSAVREPWIAAMRTALLTPGARQVIERLHDATESKSDVSEAASDKRIAALETSLKAIASIAVAPNTTLASRVSCVVSAARRLDEDHLKHTVLLEVEG